MSAITPFPTDAATDALAAACAATRLQPYRVIHKGLRVLMGHTLQQAGATDVADPAQRAALVDAVDTLLSTCEDHLAHENRFLHEPLQARAARAVRAFHDDHLEHLAQIAALRRLLQQVRDAGPQAPALAYELYLRLSQFIGENLAHMAEEESTLTRALWAHFDDAELQALIAALEGSLAPADLAFYLGWIALGANDAELAELLGGMRAAAPAPVFEQTLAEVGTAIGAARAARLQALLDAA
ncbi:hemerythrin domain-containing protein [Piscinibacter sakaiensis]|uniref:Hemerythrin-like domain-containing protein n=1 Tax=Piscinibacter sakaiensis TaxID=1547922 RepID=A0A0K8P375_PISS1|nr:hemerythrin domain-containing protein [Piscinibacter sakaiensis]GAP36630.1 hypothetical protein ISF6_2470 [Piscinibacter sakaiensis]